MLKHILYWIDQIKIPEGIRIPWFAGRWYTFLSAIERKIIRRIDVKGITLNQEEREVPIVLSLTSFPGRIHSVHLTIKSLLLQTCPADSIILWLAKEQFPDGISDENLLSLQANGLEIKFCDDLKSHKKYYYALQQEKNCIVITYDDDLIYPRNSVELLMKKHRQYPSCVVCNRGMEIVYDANGNVRPYREWKVLSNVGVRTPSALIMPSTGGGTLYPPRIMDEETFHWENIETLALSADDLWMKAMELYYGIDVIKTRKYHRTFTVVEKEQTEKLSDVNCDEGANDKVVKLLRENYHVYNEEEKK